MTALFGVRRVLELEQAVLYLCLHDGGILDMQELAKNIEVKRPTAANFIALLAATHLMYRLMPFGYGKEVLRARPNIYLANAAIAPSVLLKGKGGFAKILNFSGRQPKPHASNTLSAGSTTGASHPSTGEEEKKVMKSISLQTSGARGRHHQGYRQFQHHSTKRQQQRGKRAGSTGLLLTRRSENHLCRQSEPQRAVTTTTREENLKQIADMPYGLNDTDRTTLCFMPRASWPRFQRLSAAGSWSAGRSGAGECQTAR